MKIKIKKKKEKKREGSAVHSTGQLWVTALVSGSTCSCTGQVFYFQIPPPPRGFEYSSHSPDDLRSAVNAGVINKQKYAHAGTQLSASKMGIKDS